MTDDRCAVGVDLGGTKIAYALVDAGGRIREELRHSTDVDGGPDAVEKQIVEGVRQLQSRMTSGIEGVGIGVAGQIEKETGIVRLAPNLNWQDESLKKKLGGALDVPVTVTNDVRAAAWGEWLHGAGRGYDDLLCVFVGTGIGGAIVSGGRMLTGDSNTSGEIGHLPVDLHGAVCHCGNRGCMETLAGGWAIAERARKIASVRNQLGNGILERAAGHLDNITAEIVIDACHENDPLGRLLVEEALQALTAGLSGIVNIVNPARIILGGGIVEGLPEMVKQVDEGIRSRCLVFAAENLDVVAAGLANRAGVIGSASLVLHSKT